jgi:hypothetical protein
MNSDAATRENSNTMSCSILWEGFYDGSPAAPGRDGMGSLVDGTGCLHALAKSLRHGTHLMPQHAVCSAGSVGSHVLSLAS